MDAANTVTIRVADGFSFAEYEEEVMQKIVRGQGPPVHVVWDLRGLTSIPWHLIQQQVGLLARTRSQLWQRIDRSTVYVGGTDAKKMLDCVFALYAPLRPVQIITATPADPPNTTR